MRTLNPEQLAAFKINVDEVLQQFPKRPEDLVFFSGSIVEGFANRGSDLDVYVITKHPIFPDDLQVRENYIGQEYTLLHTPIPVNVTVIDKANLLSLIESINHSITRRKIDFSEMRNIETYHRLLQGVPVQNTEQFRDLQGVLDPDGFARVCAFNRLKYSENRHEDAVGALESDDAWTAFLAARIALEKAVEALLFANGQSNPRDKWLLRKLFTVYDEQEPWVQQFLRLYIGQGDLLDAEERKRTTRSMVRLANQIRTKAYKQLDQ